MFVLTPTLLSCFQRISRANDKSNLQGAQRRAVLTRTKLLQQIRTDECQISRFLGHGSFPVNELPTEL